MTENNNSSIRIFSALGLWTVILAALVVLALALFWLPPGLAVALLGGLALAGFFTVRLEYGLFALIFFLPAIHLTFSVHGLTINIVEIIGLLALSALAARIFFDFWQNRSIRLSWPVFWPFFLFFAVALVSALISGQPGASVWYAFRWILFFYLVYIFLPYNLIFYQRDPDASRSVLKKALAVFLASAALAAAGGFFSLIGQDFFQEFVRVKPLAIFGAYPLGDNHNLLVEIFLPAIFYCLALENLSGKTGRKICRLLLVFLSVALLGTFSRGGWLALGLVSFVYLAIFYRPNWKKIIFPALGAAAFFSPLLAYMYFQQTTSRVAVSSLDSRVVMTMIAWDGFKEKKLFGQGPGQYINLVDKSIRFKAKFGEPLDAHGLGQKIISENGLLGVLTFAFFALLIARRFWAAVRKHQSDWPWLAGVILAAAGIFFYEFFNTSYYKGKLWVPIAIALAAAAWAEKQEKYEAKN